MAAKVRRIASLAAPESKAALLYIQVNQQGGQPMAYRALVLNGDQLAYITHRPWGLSIPILRVAPAHGHTQEPVYRIAWSPTHCGGDLPDGTIYFLQ